MHVKPFPKIIAALTLALTVFTGTALAQATFRSQHPLGINKLVRYGKAAWYSENSPNINPRTANNELFSDKAMTCAMQDVSFNQRVKITNLANGKSIIVRVNDRGPSKRFVRQGRIVDLTRNAFSKIASLKDGLIKIRLELL